MKIKAPNFEKKETDYITPDKLYEANFFDKINDHNVYIIKCDEGIDISVSISGSIHTYGLPWEIVE